MEHTALGIKTINNLRDCYDTHAQKFSSTRKKNRPELAYTINHIHSLSQILQRPLHIVELGCGDGRLRESLQQQFPDTIASYIGVDISDQLLRIARDKSQQDINIQRIQDDMLHYLSIQLSESIDIIITMASYQHLPDTISRSTFLHQVYRTLQYEGERISVDRSRSQRMITKHFSPLVQSLKKAIQSRGQRKRNNLMIPFTDKGATHYRLYHIQTIFEIKKIIKKHHLQLIEWSYSSQNGDFHHNIIRARNICFVVRKTIYQSKKKKI